MASEKQARWQTARVVAADEVATGIRRIVLESPRPLRAAPGAHLDVAIDLAGRPHTRSYSIVGVSDDGRRLTISVKLSPTSRGGSQYMHRLQVGDEVRMTQPLQDFPLRVGAERYILVAGGIGITAIAAMSRVLRGVKADYRMVYVGRRRADMAYLQELEELHGDRLQIHVDDEASGLDTRALVDEVVGSPKANGTELYMCGPIRLMDAVRRHWQSAGLPIVNLRYETFGNSGWFDAEPFVVRIPRLGIETTVRADESLLEALEHAGADMMADCRKGECGLCQIRVLGVDGLIDHRDVFFSDEEKQRSEHMCSCVSRAVRDAAHATAVAPGEPVVHRSLPPTSLAVLDVDIP